MCDAVELYFVLFCFILAGPVVRQDARGFGGRLDVCLAKARALRSFAAEGEGSRVGEPESIV